MGWLSKSNAGDKVSISCEGKPSVKIKLSNFHVKDIYKILLESD